MYNRKTKDIYILFWCGDEIDSADDLKTARYLQKEYIAAFHSNAIIIKKRRVKK